MAEKTQSAGIANSLTGDTLPASCQFCAKTIDMKMLSEKTKDVLFKVRDHDLTNQQFKIWLTDNYHLLEIELGIDLCYELLVINIDVQNWQKKVTALLKTAINDDEFYIWQSKKILNLIITDKIDIVKACRLLVQLSFLIKENFIPSAFIAYESELDNIPSSDEYHQWNNEALKKVLEENAGTIKHYKELSVNEAKKLLN